MNAILEMRGISKSFPGVKALRDVNLVVQRGRDSRDLRRERRRQVDADEGAERRLSLRLLRRADRLRGRRSGASRASPTASISASSSSIRNWRSCRSSRSPRTSFSATSPPNSASSTGTWRSRRTRELLAKVGLKESPNALITNLGIGKQQLVEIAKALAKKVKLLILDEPTASLNETDSDALLKLLLEFKSQGITSIIISHKLNELASVADQITVLRDGATVETIDCHREKISEGRIIKSMVGREMSDRYPPRVPKIGERLFEVKDWRVEHPLHAGREVIKGVDLHVNRGEVVGIAGLMGAGRTELAMSVFGRAYGRNITGQAFMHGKRDRRLARSRRPSPRHRLCHRGPQEPRPGPERGHQEQRHARQPAGHRLARRDRQSPGGEGRAPISRAC